MTYKGKLSRNKMINFRMTLGNLRHMWWINYKKKATAKILFNLANDTHKFASQLSEMFTTILLKFINEESLLKASQHDLMFFPSSLPTKIIEQLTSRFYFITNSTDIVRGVKNKLTPKKYSTCNAPSFINAMIW